MSCVTVKIGGDSKPGSLAIVACTGAMSNFRCQSFLNGGQQPSMPRPGKPVNRQWTRYLQAGAAASAHNLRHGLSRQLRSNQHAFVLFASTASADVGPRPPKASAASESDLLDCVIVGAGISGLTLAQAFSSEHADAVGKVVVTEAQTRVGGNITTKKTDDGFTYETGPNSYQPSDAVLKLAVRSCQQQCRACKATCIKPCCHCSIPSAGMLVVPLTIHTEQCWHC